MGLVLSTAVACGDGSPSGEDGSAGTDGSRSGLPPEVEENCDQGPLDAPKPDCAPTPPPSTGDPYEDCVVRINQLRWECQCLPPLEQWTEGESCADEHAEYDSTQGAHAGFRDEICSPGGWAQNECPGWGSSDQVITGCLQAMWDEGPGEPFSEHGHYINMTSPRNSRVACGFYTTSEGAVWAVQNFQ